MVACNVAICVKSEKTLQLFCESLFHYKMINTTKNMRLHSHRKKLKFQGVCFYLISYTWYHMLLYFISDIYENCLVSTSNTTHYINKFLPMTGYSFWFTSKYTCFNFNFNKSTCFMWASVFSILYRIFSEVYLYSKWTHFGLSPCSRVCTHQQALHKLKITLENETMLHVYRKFQNDVCTFMHLQ